MQTAAACSGLYRDAGFTTQNSKWGLLVQLGTKSVCNTLNDESVAKVSVSVGHVGVTLRELQDFCVHSIVKVFF